MSFEVKENEIYTKEADKWINQKKHAVKLVSAVGDLMYTKGVESVSYTHLTLPTICSV